MIMRFSHKSWIRFSGGDQWPQTYALLSPGLRSCLGSPFGLVHLIRVIRWPNHRLQLTADAHDRQ